MIGLAVASLVVFIIAALFKLIGHDVAVLQWLIIIGGLLISAAVVWGWGRPWWAARSGPRA